MKYIAIIFFIFLTNSAFGQKAKIDLLPNQAYNKYELKTDKDTIIFYLSVTSHKENLPLIVYIQGSGMNSLFENRNGQIVPTSGHISWYKIGHERHRILIIEKPGVK